MHQLMTFTTYWEGLTCALSCSPLIVHRIVSTLGFPWSRLISLGSEKIRHAIPKRENSRLTGQVSLSFLHNYSHRSIYDADSFRNNIDHSEGDNSCYEVRGGGTWAARERDHSEGNV